MKTVLAYLKFIVFNALFFLSFAAKAKCIPVYIPSKFLDPKTVLIVLKTASGSLRKKMDNTVEKRLKRYSKEADLFGNSAR